MTRHGARYEVRRPAPRLEYYVPQNGGAAADFGECARRGLCGPKKSLDPRFLYDERGSEIFERICSLPEYYLTRAETEILERAGAELASLLPPRCRLIELGSGSSTKTRIILERMNESQGDVTYSPIDVSRTLEASSRTLLESYEWLRIVGVEDTYESGLRLAHSAGDAPALIAFLGSSIGNLDEGDARSFLGKVASVMRADDMLLMGVDLDKPESALVPAYDDAAGVTAEFNLNLLHRINSELGGSIDVSKFEHHVVYNAGERRIEMYLRSLEGQEIEVCGGRASLSRGELVLTEYSHKYTRDGIESMVASAGLRVGRMWHDSARRYALALCSPA